LLVNRRGTPVTNFRAKSQGAGQDPELLGLAALGFLAAEPDRLVRFLALSGMTLEDLRGRAGSPELLAAVLDHLLDDESLLFVFAEAQSLHPAEVAAARRKLPGAAGAS
jgi:hypothetical protein